MTIKAYTPKEDDTIREWYPKGAHITVAKLELAGYERSRESVRVRAIRLGIAPEHNWDEAYAKVCDYLSQSVSVADACRMAGLPRSRFYKMRQEKEGR